MNTVKRSNWNSVQSNIYFSGPCDKEWHVSITGKTKACSPQAMHFAHKHWTVVV